MYTITYDPDVKNHIDTLEPPRRAAVYKAAQVLAEDPYHPMSVAFGDDEKLRVIDLTPYIRVRYVIRDDEVFVFVYHFTDFRPPVIGHE
jgi:mRNA-degrading endonuclease RelE of RelBE toxin-antitoxin system